MQRPAFANTALTIGCKGFRSQGHHEKAANASDDLVRMESFESVTSKASMPAGPLPPSPPIHAVKKFQQQQPSHEASDKNFLSLDEYAIFDDVFAEASTATAVATTPPPPPLPPRCVTLTEGPIDTRVARLFEQNTTLLSAALSIVVHGRLPALAIGAPVAVNVSPTLIDAMSSIQAFQARRARCAIVALNFKATTVDDFVLGQNADAVAYLGPIAKSTSVQAKFRPLVPEEHFLHFFKHAMYCVRSPGHEVVLSCRVLCTTGLLLLRLLMTFDAANGGVLLVAGEI